MPVIYDVLRIPALYRPSQMILAAGGKQAIRSRIRSILDQLPPGQRVLDVGCGPVSYLRHVGLDRGRHMRTQAQFASILPPTEILALERCTYTYTGLEGLFCTMRKGPACGNAPSRGVAGGA